jgi:hypothetical protein
VSYWAQAGSEGMWMVERVNNKRQRKGEEVEGGGGGERKTREKQTKKRERKERNTEGEEQGEGLTNCGKCVMMKGGPRHGPHGALGERGCIQGRTQEERQEGRASGRVGGGGWGGTASAHETANSNLACGRQNQ